MTGPNPELAVARAEPMPVALTPQPSELNLEAICNSVMAGELTEQKLAMLERVVAITAERKATIAFVALQSDMPKIQAIRPVPNRDGSVRFKFAPYEEIMREVAPLLQRHGFTITFSTDYADGRLIKTCILRHVGGHTITNKFAVRIGQGPPGATETQSDGAASTYAKRGALCDCLNIVIDHDTDARAEGGTISGGQASDLRRRVRECGADEKAFLNFAGVPDFEDIVEAKYTMLDAFLTKKERLMQKKV